MNLGALIRICKVYADLGDSVQEQLDELIHGGTDINENAVALIEKQFLRRLPEGEVKEDLATCIEAFRKNA